MKKFLIIFLLMTGVAFADVTGAGSTTNTQSTTGTSATNTAITCLLYTSDAADE